MAEVSDPATGTNAGADKIMQPALNPNGGNGGQGIPSSDTVENAGPASVIGANGMGGTGLAGSQPSSEDEAARILGDPESPALGSTPRDTKDVEERTEPGASDVGGAGTGVGLSGGSQMTSSKVITE